MIPNHAAAFLWDAQRAAERITRFAAGRTYDDYLDDDNMFRPAGERQFEIIGQACVRLWRVDPSLAAPDLPKVIAPTLPSPAWGGKDI